MRTAHYSAAAILALSLGLSAGVPSAHATLVNNGTFVTDTTSGLDWLDVTATEGESYNTVVGQLGSTLAGWSYATLAQVSTLFTDAGGVAPYDFSGASPNGSHVEDTGAQTIANLLGSTGTFGANSGQGLIGAADGFGDHYLSTYWYNPGASYLLDCNCFETQADSSGSGSVGSFLVRSTITTADPADPAPEPASIALLGGGIVGLGATRRRKRVYA